MFHWIIFDILGNGGFKIQVPCLLFQYSIPVIHSYWILCVRRRAVKFWSFGFVVIFILTRRRFVAPSVSSMWWCDGGICAEGALPVRPIRSNWYFCSCLCDSVRVSMRYPPLRRVRQIAPRATESQAGGVSCSNALFTQQRGLLNGWKCEVFLIRSTCSHQTALVMPSECCVWHRHDTVTDTQPHDAFNTQCKLCVHIPSILVSKFLSANKVKTRAAKNSRF